mmetsp:Transcript_17692/g.34964  ORF Transcript_17692/g.34964 Transcript_17692/m.34964 type:complete len:346 (+) Transcript_17692:824-1861(+)
MTIVVVFHGCRGGCHLSGCNLQVLVSLSGRRRQVLQEKRLSATGQACLSERRATAAACFCFCRARTVLEGEALLWVVHVQRKVGGCEREVLAHLLLRGHKREQGRQRVGLAEAAAELRAAGKPYEHVHDTAAQFGGATRARGRRGSSVRLGRERGLCSFRSGDNLCAPLCLGLDCQQGRSSDFLLRLLRLPLFQLPLLRGRHRALRGQQVHLQVGARERERRARLEVDYHQLVGGLVASNRDPVAFRDRGVPRELALQHSLEVEVHHVFPVCVEPVAPRLQANKRLGRSGQLDELHPDSTISQCPYSSFLGQAQRGSRGDTNRAFLGGELEHATVRFRHHGTSTI